MNRRFGPAVALCLTCAMGCGGKLDEGDDETTNEPDQGSGGSTLQSGSTSSMTDLPPCHPGFDPNLEPARSCAWLGNELCYAEKLDACACVCPRKRNSTCISGFPGPNGVTTKVTCN